MCFSPHCPVLGLFLLPGVHLLLVAVCVLFVLLLLLLLLLRPLLQVLHLHVGHLVQSHRGLVGVGLPNLGGQLHPLVLCGAVVAVGWGDRLDELLDLLGLLDLPHLHLRDGLVGLLDLALLEGLLMLEHAQLLVDELDLVHRVVEAEHDEIQDGLPGVRLLLHLFGVLRHFTLTSNRSLITLFSFSLVISSSLGIWYSSSSSYFLYVVLS